MTTPTAQISKLSDIGNFITAGNALFTLVSKKSGQRKTFLVEKAPPREGRDSSGGFFVRLLVGPENTDSFRYLGFLYESFKDEGNLRFKRNREGWGEEACRAFEWMISKVNGELPPDFFEQAEFWHAGRCGRCGRVLTVPESIATGIGPVCASRE